MNDFELPGLEVLWSKIKAGNNVLMLATCYRPPNSGRVFWNKLQDSIDTVKQAGYKDIILAGDLNADPETREGSYLK